MQATIPPGQIDPDFALLERLTEEGHFLLPHPMHDALLLSIGPVAAAMSTSTVSESAPYPIFSPPFNAAVCHRVHEKLANPHSIKAAFERPVLQAGSQIRCNSQLRKEILQ